MQSPPINLQNPFCLSGKAYPRSRDYKLFSNSQKFASISIYPNRSTRHVSFNLPAVVARAQNPPVTPRKGQNSFPINLQGSVLDRFKIDKRYYNPKLAVLFGADTQDKIYLLMNDLCIDVDAENKNVSLPTTLYKKLREHIANTDIQVDLYSIKHLISGKMVNPLHDSAHLEQCVIGVGKTNFANYMWSI